LINSKNIIAYTKDLNILFVEDHEELRVTTSKILDKFFNNVSIAQNGEEALNIYKKAQNKYDIIISDIQMPKMNGISLVENIYKINPNQMIIILSAHDDSKYLHPLINLRIEYFIKKPLDYQELMSILLNAAKKLDTSKKEYITQEIKLSDTFTFNKDTSLVCNDKEIVSLTKFEIIFMQLITNKLGSIYSNEDISMHYESLNENLDAPNIRKLVSKLRKKLPKNSIESLYGVGYRLIPNI